MFIFFYNDHESLIQNVKRASKRHIYDRDGFTFIAHTHQQVRDKMTSYFIAEASVE